VQFIIIIDSLPKFLTIAQVTQSALCISSMLCSTAIEASQAAALQQAPMHTEAAEAGWGARSLQEPRQGGARSVEHCIVKKLFYNW